MSSSPSTTVTFTNGDGGAHHGMRKRNVRADGVLDDVEGLRARSRAEMDDEIREDRWRPIDYAVIIGAVFVLLLCGFIIASFLGWIWSPLTAMDATAERTREQRDAEEKLLNLMAAQKSE